MWEWGFYAVEGEIFVKHGLPLGFNAVCAMLWGLQSFVARLRVCYGDACLVVCQRCYGDFQAALSLAAVPFAAFVGGFVGIAVALRFREIGHQAAF